MKPRNYHVSLYIIVPLIFSCLSLLSLVITYHLVLYAWRTNTDIYVLLSFWGAINVGLMFTSSLGIFWIIFKPMDRFIKEAEKIPVLQQKMGNPSSLKGDPLAYFSNVATHITDVLSKVDATELFPDIIGQSKALRSVLAQVIKVSPADTTVLLTGESGTGKEVIANAIHTHSKRKDGPFIAVNSAAIPEGLLESELFGHEKGAFTHATATKKGKFELAHGGTLFLDEIGDMPIDTQAKMLRTLENGLCERVGGGKPIKCDVRVIAATNKNLEKMIETGAFREDLYHRLNVFGLYLPPLRERREDIPLLSSFFLEKFDKSLEIAAETLQMLVVYAWPGNIRELRNVMERAAVLAADQKHVLPQHLPSQIFAGSSASASREEASMELNLDQRLEELEKALILDALAHTGGVQVRAAERLGIKERSLWHRIKKFGIDVSSIKE